MPTIDIIPSLIIVAVAGLIHASFQLSISMLTLLSSHTIGHKRSQAHLVKLTSSFVFGTAVTTFMLLASAAYLWNMVMTSANLSLLWTICCGLLFGLGIAVWLFYYQRQSGTTTWLPRGIAAMLLRRTKATAHSAEAFSLGVVSVLAEIVFIIVPVGLSALVLVQLPSLWQVVGIVLYVVTSLASLFVVNSLIGSGHRIGRIQRWREANKGFLQFAAGSGLLVLGLYVYVEKVITVSVMAAAGGV